MNPGLAALWQEEIDRRRVKNMDLDKLSPPASQLRLNVVPTASHLFYFESIKKKLKENAAISVTHMKVSVSIQFIFTTLFFRATSHYLSVKSMSS